MSGAYRILSPGEVVAAAVLLPVLDTICLSLRFYAKRIRDAGYGIEDWLLLPALFFTITMGIASVIGVVVKVEGYLVPSGPDQPGFNISIEIFWFTEWMLCIVSGCTKLSSLFFHRRIFTVRDGHRKAFDVATLVLIGITVLWTLSFFLAIMLTCPGYVSAYWFYSLRELHCYDTKPFLLSFTWSDAITDLITITLPIPMVLGLHLSLQRKITAIGVFALAALAFVASLIRASLYVGLLGAENAGKVDPQNKDVNQAMLITNGTYWMLIESGVALMAVNLPIINSLVRREGAESLLEQLPSLVSLILWSSNRTKRFMETLFDRFKPKPSNEIEMGDENWPVVARHASRSSSEQILVEDV